MLVSSLHSSTFSSSATSSCYWMTSRWLTWTRSSIRIWSQRRDTPDDVKSEIRSLIAKFTFIMNHWDSLIKTAKSVQIFLSRSYLWRNVPRLVQFYINALSEVDGELLTVDWQPSTRQLGHQSQWQSVCPTLWCWQCPSLGSFRKMFQTTNKSYL